MKIVLSWVGSATTRHPWRTLFAWALFLALLLVLAGRFGGVWKADYELPQLPAQQGMDLIEKHLPGSANATAYVVVHSEVDRPLEPKATAAFASRLATLRHVVYVETPRLSEDHRTAVLNIRYDVPITDPALNSAAQALEQSVDDPYEPSWKIELGGEVPENSAVIRGMGESIGATAALVILLVTFGSAVAAGIPLLSALVALVVSSAGILLLAALYDVSQLAPTVAAMVGLGVGIDYALLLVSRTRENLRNGLDQASAAAQACRTAGRTVVVAASTVALSMVGLLFAGLPALESFAYTTAIALFLACLAALTLVPAGCALAGRRILGRGQRRSTQPRRAQEIMPHRWQLLAIDRPKLSVAVAVVILAALALPGLWMRTWPQDAANQSTQLTTRRAADLVQSAFGPGFTDQLTIVVPRDSINDHEVDDLRNRLELLRGVITVSPQQTSPDGGISLLMVESAYAPSSQQTSHLLAEVRSVVPSQARVTGRVAYFDEVSELLARRLPIVIAFVVGTSAFFLSIAFRSVIVPIKAAITNVISVACGYGILTLVFQWGWGARLIGVDHQMPISSWVPALMFTILFGLSMDYEVFLLGRIQEEWRQDPHPRRSVRRGLVSTRRVITAAAAIMVAVFLGFAAESDVTVKMIGVGMAASIFVDATLVRLILVPGLMVMLGRWNWWWPALRIPRPSFRSGVAGQVLPDAQMANGVLPLDPETEDLSGQRRGCDLGGDQRCSGPGRVGGLGR